MRAFRYISPEDRRWLEENLICLNCGNDTYFSIDLKINHILGNEPEGISVEMDRAMIDNVTESISQNVLDMLDKANWKNKSLFKCANCNEDTAVEYEPRVLEICYSNACGGCWCHGYPEKDYVLDCCGDCIKKRDGRIYEDECETICEYADNSLRESREHYNIVLKHLKAELGYFN